MATKQSEAASYFLSAMASFDFTRDKSVFTPDMIEDFKKRALEIRAQRTQRKNPHQSLGLKNLLDAYKAIYRYDKEYRDLLPTILERAKQLKELWQEQNAGQFIPYERGGGYVVKAPKKSQKRR